VSQDPRKTGHLTMTSGVESSWIACPGADSLSRACITMPPRRDGCSGGWMRPGAEHRTPRLRLTIQVSVTPRLADLWPAAPGSPGHRPLQKGSTHSGWRPGARAVSVGFKNISRTCRSALHGGGLVASGAEPQVPAHPEIWQTPMSSSYVERVARRRLHAPFQPRSSGPAHCGCRVFLNLTAGHRTVGHREAERGRDVVGSRQPGRGPADGDTAKAPARERLMVPARVHPRLQQFRRHWELLPAGLAAGAAEVREAERP